jgi:hypothetical protein
MWDAEIIGMNHCTYLKNWFIMEDFFLWAKNINLKQTFQPLFFLKFRKKNKELEIKACMLILHLSQFLARITNQ